MRLSNNIFLAGIAIAVLGYLISPSIIESVAPSFALGAIMSTFASILIIKYASNDTTSSRKGYHSSTDSQANTKTLYVGNLPYKANEIDVQKLFEKYGSVVSVRLMKDRYTGKRRGFGFIVMDASSADTAIKKLNGAEFGQRNLKVKEANEPKPKEREKAVPVKSES